jgi:hypothetical protein
MDSPAQDQPRPFADIQQHLRAARTRAEILSARAHRAIEEARVWRADNYALRLRGERLRRKRPLH